MWHAVEKPTYYLWKQNYNTEEELQETKDKYIKNGFRVVIYRDGLTEKNIQEGIKALIKNHI